ncbi:MAG: hypothetical protein LBH25_10250 [Fibromonadaceae bacterium]|nr:hypothetical protein [Fibromonadaceae bacterium]
METKLNSKGKRFFAPAIAAGGDEAPSSSSSGNGSLSPSSSGGGSLSSSNQPSHETCNSSACNSQIQPKHQGVCLRTATGGVLARMVATTLTTGSCSTAARIRTGTTQVRTICTVFVA